MYWKQQVFRMALLLVATLSPLAARAGVCSFDPGQNPSTTNMINLTGSITVGRDVPIGTEIYRGSYHGTPSFWSITCTPGTNDRARRFVSTPHPRSSYVHPTYGNNVYETGVAGVGVVVWRSGNAVPTLDTSFTQPGVFFKVDAQLWYDFSLIKTGNVSAGTVRATDIPPFDYRIGDNQLLIQAARYTGALNIVAQTCVTPNVTRALGNFTLDALKGVGTTTPTVQVDVALNQCPAFFGRYRNDVNNTPSAPGVSVTPNAINFQIDPTGAVLDRANGVIALAAGGATGMGVQILDGNGRPVAFGTKLSSNLVLNTTTPGNYTLRLGARYYQVNATTTPGAANASVTMTFEYL